LEYRNIIAAILSTAELPALNKKIFLTTTKSNDSIYGFKMYIRGKPWVVAVDDYLLMYNSASDQY